MKILFCTTTYDSLSNGPAKFAKIIYGSAQGDSQIEIHILTEDTNTTAADLHFCPQGKFAFIFKPVGFLYRMFSYAVATRKLQAEHNYDLIWHNNAIIGYHSAKNNPDLPHIGMINDDNSALASVKKYGFSKTYVRFKSFSLYEKASVQHFKKIILNSVYLKKSYYKNMDLIKAK